MLSANNVTIRFGKRVLFEDVNIQFLNDIYNLNILDGVECVHSKHNKEQVEFLMNFCKKYDLLMSGGSDFHTDKKQTLGYTELGEISDKFCLKKP